jgi:hypothetical protein
MDRLDVLRPACSFLFFQLYLSQVWHSNADPISGDRHPSWNQAPLPGIGADEKIRPAPAADGTAVPSSVDKDVRSGQ